MYIPYTDTVVVVASNPEKAWWSPGRYVAVSGPKHQPIEESRRLAPMRDLLRELYGGVPPVLDVDKLSLAGLRDELLKVCMYIS